ncbi:MAG TPA: carbohydrate porin [Steroidobacteraceae bacterium]
MITTADAMWTCPSPNLPRSARGVCITLLSCLATGVSVASDDAPAPSPLALFARYTGDQWWNTRGGLERGDAYVDNLLLSATLDGEQGLGLRGLTLHASTVYGNDTSLSGRLVGDTMNVSNIEAGDGVRIYEAWAEWGMPGNRSASLRVGFYDLNSEFDFDESRTLFLHSAYGIGHDLAQSGLNGPSIFPTPGLAARVAWRAGDVGSLRLAVLDGVPGSDDGSARPSLHTSSKEGVLWIIEGDRGVGAAGRVAVGAWRYSAYFDDLLAVTPGGEPEQRNDNQGAYLSLSWNPPYDGSVGDRRHSFFLRAGVANGRVNDFDRFVAAGWNAPAPWPANHRGRWGIAASSAHASRSYQEQQARLGQPVSSAEWNVELTWRMQVTPWLALQPDVQYVGNPGLNRQLGDAVVVGVRVDMALAW